ncbi:glycosyltransferase [Rhodococcoides yunnanense]|uniref:glycosyltransferase n=1 Tax=Rhodococcoides yunnanense TaxID=278209 RepID=UPI000934D6BF|nr:glycosyltransferase [Rhodococcus yunnanensis]
MTHDVSVDVVVVCSDADPSLLRQCIDSVRASYAASDVEGSIVLVDNVGSGVTVDATDASGVLVLRTDSVVGFGSAVNLAVAESTSDSILVLDPGATLAPDGLARFLDAADHHRNSLIGGWLQRDGDVQSDAYMQWDFSMSRSRRRARFARSLAEVDEDVVVVEKVCGSALFADRKLLGELGPFDLRFRHDEDADLSRRAAAKGVVLLVARRAEIEHVCAQRDHGRELERARADAAIRLTSYHCSRSTSYAQRIELAAVTFLGVFAGAAPAPRRARLARLGQVWRWGFRRDAPPFVP